MMVMMMVRSRWRRGRRRRRRHLRFIHVELGQQRRVEFVQVFGHWVRVHLDVRETLGVSLEVDLEVALGGEPVAANVALERPFARVRPDVNLQSRVAAKHFPAVAATVFEQLIFLSTRSAGSAATAVTSVRSSRMAVSSRASHSVTESEFIGQIGGQQTLRRIVQYLLGSPLQ